MVSKLDLLEKRLKVSPVKTQTNDATLVKSRSVFTAVDQVHELAHELWKDAHIFGPHQANQCSPTKAQVQPSTTLGLDLTVSPSVDHAVQRKTSAELDISNVSAEELISNLSVDTVNILDALAISYCEDLDNNICLNVLAEVELWIQLLIENYDSSLSSFAPKDNAFSTVASRVYFISKVFELQMFSVLMHIDSQVCYSLCRNYKHRVPKVLRKQLEELLTVQEQCALKVDQVLNQPGVKKTGIKDERVAFQQETDGRSNFFSQSDFHAFCKQRDLFYSIKDTWMNRNVDAVKNVFIKHTGHRYRPNPSASGCDVKKIPPKGINSEIKFGSSDTAILKIKQIMQLNSNPTNVSRLAALFVSQIVLDCANSIGEIKFQFEDENLRQIFQTNPSKFKKLENRFPKPEGHSNDPLAFCKYFIDLASWADFNQHLIDRCILMLREIDNSIGQHEFRNPKEIIQDLNKSRIIAQILGYLHFHPYRYSINAGIPRNTLEFEAQLQNQIQLRFYQRPLLNLTDIICKAIASRKLTFTLPWVVELLCQANSATYQLHSYSNILTLIAQLYRSILSVKEGTPQLKTLCRSNQAFLRFYCSNLFQKPDFPSNLIIEMNTLVSRNEKLNCVLSGVTNVAIDDYEEGHKLDSLPVVGEVLNYVLFEHQMRDINTILCTGPKKQSLMNTINVLTPKNIRPRLLDVSSFPHTSRTDLVTSSEKFQKELQASFFLSNPPSVKRTVDFITENIVSNYLRQLRTTLYPQFRDECALKDVCGDGAVKPFITQAVTTFKLIYLQKSIHLIDLLLGESLNTGALQACKSIVSQTSVRKICDWMEVHVKKSLFYALNTTLNPPIGTSVDSSPHVKSPTASITSSFQHLIRLQRTLQKIYILQSKSLDITKELLPLLNTKSLGDSQLSVRTTLDVALALLTFSPHEFSDAIENEFVEYWISAWKYPIKILCPRNVVLFEQSDNPQLTWNIISRLVTKLIQVNVIYLKNVEEQCLEFLRYDWPPTVLARISELSTRVIRSSSARTEEIEVIEWISWACSEGTCFN